MRRWCCFVPGPLPGLNQLVAAAKRRAGNGWNGYATAKRRWTAHAAAVVRQARPPRFLRAVLEFLWVEASRRRDPDNVAAGGRKIVLDVLVAEGVLRDDGWRAVAGWTDRFMVDPRRPGVVLRIIGWVRAASLAAWCLAGWADPASAASPLNLAPEWPARVDDAYPVASGLWQVQTAVRQDWTAAANRFTARTDVRIGMRDGWEMDLGFTPAQAGTLGGDPVDHRAVRVGILARLTGQDGAWPSQALRVTVSPPIAGGSRAPSLRADWLDSWALSRRTWVHANAGYLVAPDPVPGGLTPGRRQWWQARIGLVHALTTEGVGLVTSVGIGPSPFLVADQLRADPELAIVVPLGAGFAFSAGGGVLVQADSVMRVQAGLSWTF
jgi:hypothetical protein